MRVFRILCLFLLTALVLSAAPAAAKEKEKKLSRKERQAAVEKLPEKYRAWVEEVDILITDPELRTFLELEKDYQRDAFIKRFWEVRDTFPATARNEFKDRWDVNLVEARTRFGTLDDERSRFLLLNGAPAGSVVSKCSTVIWPLEVWFYAASERVRGEFVVVFYRKWGAGLFRVWQPHEGLAALYVDSVGPGQQPNLTTIVNGCLEGQAIASGIAWVLNQGMGYDLLQQKLLEKPESKSGEWVSSFNSYSTDLPENAAPLPAKLDVEFPGRYQNRTVVQGLISVPASGAGQAQLGPARSYNLLLVGEVIQGGELFDSFRYKFDFPVGEETLPLAFQRSLRPGDYKLVIRLEDINSGKFFREERSLTVPAADRAAPAPPATPADAWSARLLAEANAAIANGETTVKIIPPHGELQTGMLRFDTLTTGSDIEKVTFALDGKAVLTKKKPPFSVELDLGPVPRTRTLAVTAFDKNGTQLAGDELLINAAENRFQVKLVEPRKGQRYESSLLARAEVEVPDGQTLERVEFFLNEARIATLYQAPYAQPVVLPKDQPLAYVRAVAYLADGNSTEQLVFVNAPEDLEEIDIDFVELYTSVFDRQGRPVPGLAQKDFSVSEDGVKQEIVRFETVTDLPIHAAVALDVSGSMEENLDQARQAALRFLEDTIQPKDRAALVTFNDHPNLAVKFTNDVASLAGGLAGLKAERGTALYDTVIFSLYYFNGVKGQRAIVLLSDGKDEGSRFTYEDAVEYARRAGVAIYPIGLGDDIEKKKLSRFAEETGGRAFFLKGVNELGGIYSEIEKELRSKYLIAYQSTNTTGETGFRSVEMKLAQPGLEAKTLRGYYP